MSLSFFHWFRPIHACLVAILVLWNVSHVQAGDTMVGNKTIDRTIQLRTHSIFAPYIDQDLQNRWWDFGADAYINTNKHIRLTRPVPSQMGWLWSRLPITAPNFIVELEFKISGESNNLFGDGIALWLTKTRAQPGPVFGSVNGFEGLGIFLDTYANSRHTYPFPRIVGMLGDGMKQYDVGDDGDSTSIGSCSASYRRTNVATKLKVTYIKDTFLDVKIQHKAWDEWTDCFAVENISLPPAPFLGISAMTGDVSDAHDVISVTTSSAIYSAPDAPRNKISKPLFRPSSSSSGSWLGFFFKLFLVVGVCVGGWYAYQMYLEKNGGGYGRGSFTTGRGFGARGFGGNLFSDGKRF